MQGRRLASAAHAAMVLGLASSGCGGAVEAPFVDHGATGAGGGAALGSSSGGGGAPGSPCETQGGHCISLDLPSCGEGFFSAFYEGACEDPGGAGQSQCCLPAADACADATLVDLASGTVSIRGDTTSAADEHPALTCDSHQVAFTLDQGQLYFRFHAEAGRTYEFALTTSFYGFLYVFPEEAGCSFAAIEEACSSDGATGMVSGIVNPHSEGKSKFSPVVAGDYVFAVDGDTSPGPFEVTVIEQ